MDQFSVFPDWFIRKKFFPETTFLPVFLSNSRRAFLAIRPPFFAGFFVFFKTFRLQGFGNLSGWKFGQRGENKLRFIHMIPQILTFQTFQIFMLSDSQIRPFLMDNVRENREFVFFFDIIFTPIISQLVPCFLPHHSLLNPFFASPQALPVFPSSVD